ncbi:PID-CTERM protein-sorting domain-containing protein [Hymenobacter sp. UYCo722]|uniref:PID-CTERM protein-sorting domain-containing protein n=1 Tax=Hymenobacter sp. UYCo722 TaxID=3156335 RepID=UPI0033920454
MNKSLKPIFLTLALLLIGGLAFAQAPADGGPSPTGPTAIPLDGGASLLLAGGVAYGLRRLRQRRQK